MVAAYNDCLNFVEENAERAASIMKFDVEGTVAAITADAVAFSRSGEVPPLLPWRDQAADGLWYGAFRFQAAEEQPMKEGSAHVWTIFQGLRRDALRSAEPVRTAQLKALSIREALIDILDDITLSRYVGGICRWCPGTSRRRQTPARRAKSSR